MKNLKDYINENELISYSKDIIGNAVNEGKFQIDLPYTFDIYNEGAKNKNYKITKANIKKIYFGAERTEESQKENGVKVIKFLKSYAQMIRLPLPADRITYKDFPTKENTKNWTVIPEIQEYTYAGAWYSDKYVEYNYYKYNEDWNNWLTMLKPYMKGKISVTIDESSEKEYDNTVLEIKVNNNIFNKEREEKIKELKDVKHLKEWADEADRKEKEAIKKHQEEEENRKKAEEEWKKWWNSLSDDEKLSWTMGYGQTDQYGNPRYNGD